VRAIDLAADTHTLIALLAEEFILILLVMGAVAEIEYGLLAKRFSFVLAGDLILVVLKITLLTEVGLLSETVVSGNDV
jgi:hypothetical protein